MLADWFWPAAGIIYAGFAILIVDVGLEPELSLKWKLPLAGALCVLAIGFTFGFVFVDTPLPITAVITDGDYPEGTKIAGISFGPRYTELRLAITNSTNHEYRDLNLVIQPVVPIAEIAQLTNVSDVTFADKNEFTAHVLLTHQGARTAAIPMSLVATTAGYRMRCARLAPHQSITVVMALAEVKNDVQVETNERDLGQIIRNPNEVLHFSMSDLSSYWIGYKDGHIYARRPTTQAISVKGDFLALQRVRDVDESATVTGFPQ